MARIVVVGAGQAGLQLAIGLLGQGHEVEVVSNRPPPAIAAGRVLSSQCMFDFSLQTERVLRLGLWDSTCPPVEGISITVPGPDGGKALDWAARLDAPAQSVDQRVKVPRWMEELEARGGRLSIHEAGVDDLERYAREHDLVVVAAGKGEIAQLFARDPQRCAYDRPQRALALTYVTGMVPRPEFSAVCFNLMPGVGEYFVFPALTTTGPCEIMVFEGVPGGPMDCWSDVASPAEHLQRSLRILRDHLPWEHERCREVELTDENGILAGRFAPIVRHPVATLPSGAKVLGLADVVVLNDPITGQGSNNAAKCAASYLESIAEHGDAPYDEAFMVAAFERYWEYAQYPTTWTNALLAPPPPHVLQLLGAAQGNEAIAHRFANGFNDPRDFFDWFMDPDKAAAYLAEVA